jgi:hypothetical protein
MPSVPAQHVGARVARADGGRRTADGGGEATSYSHRRGTHECGGSVCGTIPPMLLGFQLMAEGRRRATLTAVAPTSVAALSAPPCY